MKKGFTMLEMLAVIVLLGVISAIVVPEAIKRTSQAEANTISSNMLSYIKEVETSVVKEMGKPNGFDLVGTYTVTKNKMIGSKGEYTVVLSGKLPESGKLEISDRGKVITATFKYGDCQGVYNGQKVAVTCQG